LTARVELPERVREAFKGKVYLNLAQLAKAFGYSPRTLVRFCDLGVLNWHQRGVGTLSRHRAFTIKDVREFWGRTERMELPQPRKRRTGGSHATRQA